MQPEHQHKQHQVRTTAANWSLQTTSLQEAPGLTQHLAAAQYSTHQVPNCVEIPSSLSR